MYGQGTPMTLRKLTTGRGRSSIAMSGPPAHTVDNPGTPLFRLAKLQISEPVITHRLIDLGLAADVGETTSADSRPWILLRTPRRSQCRPELDDPRCQRLTLRGKPRAGHLVREMPSDAAWRNLDTR